MHLESTQRGHTHTHQIRARKESYSRMQSVSQMIEQSLAAIPRTNEARVKDLLYKVLRSQIHKQKISPNRPEGGAAHIREPRVSSHPPTSYCTFLDGFKHDESRQALLCVARMLKEMMAKDPLPLEIRRSSVGDGEFREVILDCGGCKWHALRGSIIWWLQWIPAEKGTDQHPLSFPSASSPESHANQRHNIANSSKVGHEKGWHPANNNKKPSVKRHGNMKSGNASLPEQLPAVIPEGEATTGNNKDRKRGEMSETFRASGCACIISCAGGVFNYGEVRRILFPHLYREEMVTFTPVTSGRSLEQAAGISRQPLVMHQFSVAVVNPRLVEAVHEAFSRIA